MCFKPGHRVSNHLSRVRTVRRKIRRRGHIVEEVIRQKMSKPKILVVEDEQVVATDIEECLHKLGYAVVGAAASGVGAIRRAMETEPDLVLMDIKLKGAMDGVAAAGEMHDRLRIPVVYLTAYADDEILERAKKTSPSGYVLKPFDERALRSAVEIALHRYPEERKLAQNERRLVTALRGFGEAVILTRDDGRITFMNRVAERLTGWRQSEAAGRDVDDVFATIHSRMGTIVRNPVTRVLREGVPLGLGDHTMLVSRYGTEVWIEGNVTPLRDEDREIVGAALVFRRIDDRDSREYLPGWRHGAAKQLETMNRVAEGVATELSRVLATAAAEQSAGEEKSGTSDTGADAAIARGRQLAEALLEITRRGTVRRRVVGLNETLEPILPLLGYVVGEASEVETTLCPEAGDVQTDPVLLRRLVLEVIGEARGRLPFGGRITLETDRVELLGEYARTHTRLAPGVYATVNIEFAGTDILPSSEDVQRELPLVFEMVRKLGGDIVVQTEAGRRTNYEIYLPTATLGRKTKSGLRVPREERSGRTDS